jgi:hypothetical protein
MPAQNEFMPAPPYRRYCHYLAKAFAIFDAPLAEGDSIVTCTPISCGCDSIAADRGRFFCLPVFSRGCKR